MTLRPLPQRLTAPAPYGSLLKRTAAARQPRKKAVPLTAPTHLALVRQLPCLKCGLEPCGEAHHARGGRQTMGRRRPDSETVSLCRSCHQLDPDALHRIGEQPFWREVGVDPVAVAVDLFRATGDLAAMRAVCLMAIAKRSCK